MEKNNSLFKRNGNVEQSNSVTPLLRKSVNIREKLNYEAKVLDETLNVLESGSELRKVKGWNKHYERKYIVDLQYNEIYYLGTKKTYCLKPKTSIEFRDLHEIRRGWSTDVFNRIAARLSTHKQTSPYRKPPLEEEHCFSIIYGKNYKSLDLVCPNERVCNTWVQGLSYLLAKHKGLEREQAINAWLKRKFEKADVNGSRVLSFEECLLLLNDLNKEIDESDARHLFEKCKSNRVSVNGEIGLDQMDFIKIFRLLDDRPELKEIFEKFSGGTKLWGPSELQNFLITEEKMNWITLDIAQEIINTYESDNINYSGYMSYDGFCKMLQSDDMDIFNYDHRQCVYQDMTEPLNNYYIASSHNTYLVADQLIGNSSVEGYIQALRQGCRCIELDLWDGPDGEPKITHGYTLTSEILLKDVLIDAILPYAFETSEYPLILSVENHLSTYQQEVAASQFKQIIGDFLFIETIPEDMNSLPSPVQLKNKIVIKAKKLQENNSSDTEEEITENDINQNQKTSKSLSDLINICTGVKFYDFPTSLQGQCYEFPSISEGKGFNLLVSSSSDFIRLTQKQMVRIYPSNKRQNSSNYDPIVFWNVGCQAVALNYQTNCDHMLCNRAKFCDNGNCGYVLKPTYLRSYKREKSSTNDLLQLDSVSRRLTIKIISGQRLPKLYGENTDITDPYVVITIRGHDNDQNVSKTDYVKNNGFNPEWNETFTYTVNFWELSFVIFAVWNRNMLRDTKIGETCIPCSSLLSGYRHVHLFQSKQPGSIFVHIKIEEL